MADEVAEIVVEGAEEGAAHMFVYDAAEAPNERPPDQRALRDLDLEVFLLCQMVSSFI